jgi:hypothetical protein
MFTSSPNSTEMSEERRNENKSMSTLESQQDCQQKSYQKLLGSSPSGVQTDSNILALKNLQPTQAEEKTSPFDCTACFITSPSGAMPRSKQIKETVGDMMGQKGITGGWNSGLVLFVCP